MLQLILILISYFQVLDLNAYISQLLDLYNTITGLSADMTSYSNFITIDNINSMTDGQIPDGAEYLENKHSIKCPQCLARGIEVYVLPEKHCPRCYHLC